MDAVFAIRVVDGVGEDAHDRVHLGLSNDDPPGVVSGFRMADLGIDARERNDGLEIHFAPGADMASPLVRAI